jgi:hypothetical protein
MQLLLSGQPDIQWHKTYGGNGFDEFYSLHQTKDGGFIALSLTSSGTGDVVNFHGAIDYWVLKLDSIGTIEWSRAYGGSAYDWPWSLRQTLDGGYIAVGFTQSSDGDVTGFHGGYDAWILKIGATGTIEWEKSLGGTELEEARAVELTNDGGYIIAGGSNSEDGDIQVPGKGYIDYWIAKVDSLGEIEWQKKYGGQGEDIAMGIKPVSDGGYIAIGETQSNDGDVIGNNGNVDLWLVKMNHLGELEWQNTLGGLGYDSGRNIKEVSDGYIICGHAGSNNGDVVGHHGSLDAWVLKLDLQGEIVWQKALGGSNADYARDFVVEEDGSVIVTGSTKSKDGDVKLNNGIVLVWLLKLSPDGQLIWQKTYGGTLGEISYTICKTEDRGLAVGAFTWSEDGDLQGITSQGQNDAWLIKFALESTSTTQAPTHHLELFPNPATHTVFLNTPQYEESLQTLVTDLSGRELYRQQVNSFDGLEVSSLSKGVYLVEAIGEGGVRYVGKLLKQ